MSSAPTPRAGRFVPRDHTRQTSDTKRPRLEKPSYEGQLYYDHDKKQYVVRITVVDKTGSRNRKKTKTEDFAIGEYGGEENAKLAAEAFRGEAEAELLGGASLEDAFAAAGIAPDVIDRYKPDPAYEKLPPGISYTAKGPEGTYKVWSDRARTKVKRGKSFSCDTHSKLGAKTLAAQYVIWCYAKAAKSYADFAQAIRYIYRLPPAFRVEPLIALGSCLGNVPDNKINAALDSWTRLAEQTMNSGSLDDFTQASDAKQPEGLSDDQQVEWKRNVFVSFVSASVIRVPGRQPPDSVKERSDALKHLVKVSNAAPFAPAARAVNFMALAEEYRAPEAPEFRPAAPMTPAEGDPSDPMFDTKTAPLRWIKYDANKGRYGAWKVPTKEGRQGKSFACELHGMATAYWLLVQSVLSKGAKSVSSRDEFTNYLKCVERLPAAFRVEPLITLGSKIAELPRSETEEALTKWVELARQTNELGATDDFAQAVGAQEPHFNAGSVAAWRSKLPVHFVNSSVLAQLGDEPPSDPGKCAALVKTRFELLHQLTAAAQEKERGVTLSERVKGLSQLAARHVIRPNGDPHRE